MVVLLMVLEGDVLPGAVVVERCSMLRMMSLRNTLASRAPGSWSVQPGKDRTSRRMALPPGKLEGWS